MEGCLVCLTELNISKDNPAWAKAAPAPELPKPLVPSSPMILPSFDEEYMNQLEKDKDAADAVIALVNEAAKLVEVARKIITEETREDAAQDPPIEL